MIYSQNIHTKCDYAKDYLFFVKYNLHIGMNLTEKTQEKNNIPLPRWWNLVHNSDLMNNTD